MSDGHCPPSRTQGAKQPLSQKMVGDATMNAYKDSATGNLPGGQLRRLSQAVLHHPK